MVPDRLRSKHLRDAQLGSGAGNADRAVAKKPVTDAPPGWYNRCMPTLAVVMAVFNGERFLARQLDSIARQTHKPDLLVISDDGSSDRSVEIVSRFARGAPFETSVVHGPGAGLARNFWSAAGSVSTDLVAWADQDDVWLPEKLERCMRAMIELNAGLVCHSALTIDSHGRGLGRRYPDYRQSVLREPLGGDPWHVPSGFATMFRRTLLDSVPFERRPRSHQTLRLMNHDHAVSLRAFANCRRVELSETLALYRQHSTNAAGDPTSTGIQAVAQTLRPRAEEFAELAAIATEYREFLASLHSGDGALSYFAQLAARCQRRAHIFGGAHFYERLRRVGSAARAGVYEQRSRGGFGYRGLTRDLFVCSVMSNRRVQGLGS
jgi:glycosyltransferase involved in cell wall biosynthesis